IADLAGIGPRDGPDAIRARLHALAGRTADAGAAARTEQRLALLFGLGESRDETAFVHEVQAGFISVVEGLARDHAVLVMFEDAQSLKAPMLDLIERVATRGQSPRRARRDAGAAPRAGPARVGVQVRVRHDRAGGGGPGSDRWRAPAAGGGGDHRPRPATW